MENDKKSQKREKRLGTIIACIFAILAITLSAVISNEIVTAITRWKSDISLVDLMILHGIVAVVFDILMFILIGIFRCAFVSKFENRISEETAFFTDNQLFWIQLILFIITIIYIIIYALLPQEDLKIILNFLWGFTLVPLYEKVKTK